MGYLDFVSGVLIISEADGVGGVFSAFWGGLGVAVFVCGVGGRVFGRVSSRVFLGVSSRVFLWVSSRVSWFTIRFLVMGVRIFWSV